MNFYETDLEVIDGAFTLGEVLHNDVLPLIPLRFQLNVPLKTFHHTCDCQCFYLFSSEYENSDISFYLGTNDWETLRIVNEDTREIINLDSRYINFSDVKEIEILLIDLNKKYPENIKSRITYTLPKEVTTIPKSFLNRIRVNVNGKIYDKDGNIKN